MEIRLSVALWVALVLVYFLVARRVWHKALDTEDTTAGLTVHYAIRNNFSDMMKDVHAQRLITRDFMSCFKKHSKNMEERRLPAYVILTTS